jgi:aspartate/methionine/tyrosine aminotransferase
MTERRDFPLAARMAAIEPFYVMEILARAREMEAAGEDIVHMSVGEPDFVTPAPIREAAKQALDAGLTGYTTALGIPELRRAIALHYRETSGIDLDPRRIVVTTGASASLLLALGVILNPGDEVLGADPGYPCNRHFIRLLEGTPVAVPVDADSAYQLTAEHLQRAWTAQTAAVLLASPSNPTGTVIPDAEIRAMADVVRRRGGVLIMDEIYHGLVYGDPLYSALTVADDIFIVNSFSKYFNMTGWRLGWLVVPERYLDAVDRLAQNLYISAPTLSQYAALAAFAPDTRALLEQQRAEFRQRRDYLLPALRELGFTIPVTPQGAFYIYADCTRFTNDSYAFTHRVLEEAKVAITPGKDFGRHRAAQHVRFTYTNSLEHLEEGVTRLGRFLQRG